MLNSLNLCEHEANPKECFECQLKNRRIIWSPILLIAVIVMATLFYIYYQDITAFIHGVSKITKSPGTFM